MSFSPPSALQVAQVHQHGVPLPLRSASAVSAALTAYSLIYPVGLFHPTALLGLLLTTLRVARLFSQLHSLSLFRGSRLLSYEPLLPRGDLGDPTRGSFATGSLQRASKSRMSVHRTPTLLPEGIKSHVIQEEILLLTAQPKLSPHLEGSKQSLKERHLRGRDYGAGGTL